MPRRFEEERRPLPNRRILVVDDSPAIREDFRKILAAPPEDGELGEMETELFGTPCDGSAESPRQAFEIDTASQGEMGLGRVVSAIEAGRPYALVFVDVRMPPGWDGVETAARILAHDPDIQVVICTAYADYSWADMGRQIGQTDRLLILKKPFEDVEVLQLADALTVKWALANERRRHVADLEAAVRERTMELSTTNARLCADIVERRKAEIALQVSEGRFRVLSTHAPVGIFEADAKGACCFVNERWCQLTGLSPEEALGDGWVRAVFADDRERILSEWRAAASTGREFSQEYRYQGRETGKPVWVIGLVVALRDAGGNITGFLGTTMDVTERKQADAQLVLSDRMASLGKLAAGVAHEINNPLSYIIANLDMMAEEIIEQRKDLSPKSFRELLELTNDARKGSDRVRKIVHGMKTFSRGDENTRAVLDVRPLLDLSIDMTFNEIRHRARIVKDYGRTPPIEADEARLGQVFINLLINAAHAFRDGQPDRNVIRIASMTDAEGRAVIEVRDNGLGMTEDILYRIFDPFFTTKPVGEGTGLGLSICHGIVTGLGGEITAESVVGQGSVFRVVLPPAKMSRAEVPDAAPALGDPVGRRRVLVVDDDLGVRVAMSRVLQGHEVHIVGSGLDALELLRSSPRFDVIFCDLMMPGMTGMAFHTLLSKTMPDQADRMVFITGGAFTPDARAFLDRVPNERIDKPFDPRNLRALVQRAGRANEGGFSETPASPRLPIEETGGVASNPSSSSRLATPAGDVKPNSYDARSTPRRR